MQVLELTHARFASGREATLSALYQGLRGGPDALRFLCFALEDQRQPGAKVHGETRIPAGRYQIKLRRAGGMHDRYARRFAGIHRGMLHLQNVPGFEWVYYHVGNTDDESLGCPLVGLTADSTGRMSVGRSAEAYAQFYPLVAGAIERGQEVWTNVLDIA